MHSLRNLLHSIIDYAGLFPPASLDLPSAAANYATYRASDVRWALGRFVIPATRLTELETAGAAALSETGAPWKITALAGPDLEADLDAIAAFNRRQSARAIVDTIELKAGTRGAIADALHAVEDGLDVFVEIPIADDPAPLVELLADRGARAKIRTGGVTPDAFPSAPALLRFLRRATDSSVPFKATAGLHHPLRGAYRLTYEPDSACATMFGFLNLFLAAAFLLHGLDDRGAIELLEEPSAASFRFEVEGIGWRSHWLDNAELRQARQLALAFGSCSFREPVDDLRAMRLL